jgi:large subunit ribosomal protein L21
MYAIIETGGKQYKVSEGEEIKVEKLEANEGDEITFDNVVAVSDGSLKVGSDVSGASVKATVLDQGRGRKVIVYKYKRKSGYHKKNGHRQPFTKVRIDAIKA